jgi:hypothetical protein
LASLTRCKLASPNVPPPLQATAALTEKLQAVHTAMNHKHSGRSDNQGRRRSFMQSSRDVPCHALFHKAAVVNRGGCVVCCIAVADVLCVAWLLWMCCALHSWKSRKRFIECIW